MGSNLASTWRVNQASSGDIVARPQQRIRDAGQALSSQRIIMGPAVEGLARSFANPSGIKRIVEQTRKVKEHETDLHDHRRLGSPPRADTGDGSGQAGRQRLGRQLARYGRQLHRQEIYRRDRFAGGIHHRRHDRPAEQGEARQGQSRERHYLHDLARRLALRQRWPLRDARSRESAEREQLGAAGQDQSVSHRHLAYVYTIGYRPDLLKGVTFESWADLWRP